MKMIKRKTVNENFQLKGKTYFEMTKYNETLNYTITQYG